MTRRSSTLLTISLRIRLPGGVKSPEVLDAIKRGLSEHISRVDHQNPLATLPVDELVMKVSKREVTYI